MSNFSDDIAFLQVTATPYSLYLQPEGYEAAVTGGNYVFKPSGLPLRNRFPFLASMWAAMTIWEFQDNDPRSHLIVEVSDQEQDALRRSDRRKISRDRVLDSPNTVGLRRAIVTFVLAVCVRRWQQQDASEKPRKYAMIIHNDTQRSAHAWQDQVIDWIFDAILKADERDPATLRPLFDEAYDDLHASVTADRGCMPDRNAAFGLFIEALQSDDVVREKVNSDQDVMALLDRKGEPHFARLTTSLWAAIFSIGASPSAPDRLLLRAQSTHHAGGHGVAALADVWRLRSARPSGHAALYLARCL